jgi:hypothetical protein
MWWGNRREHIKVIKNRRQSATPSNIISVCDREKVDPPKFRWGDDSAKIQNVVSFNNCLTPTDRTTDFIHDIITKFGSNSQEGDVGRRDIQRWRILEIHRHKNAWSIAQIA